MFIKNVNLDLAVTAETIGGVRGATALKLRDSAGRELGVLGGVDFDIEKLTSPVIPSGPVTTMICISPTGAATAAVIVGYRVCRTGLEPLFLIDPPADSTRFLFAGAHGLVRVDDGALFPNLEQAKATVVGAQDQAEPEIETVEQKGEVVDMPKPAGGRRVR